MIQEYELELAREIGLILQQAGVNPGAKLLELGSGSGHLSAALAQHGYSATLLDFSRAALEKARECFDFYKLPGNFVQADLMSLPQGIGEFDLAWNSGVMEHFDDLLLHEAFKSMRSLGAAQYLFIVPNPDSFPYLLFRFRSMNCGEWDYGWEALRRDYDKILAATGFEVTQTTYIGAKLTERLLAYGTQSSEWPLASLVEAGVIAKHECYLVAYLARPCEIPALSGAPAPQPVGPTVSLTSIFDQAARNASSAQPPASQPTPLPREIPYPLESYLATVAKTKPYRIAHLLRRLERDCLKGSWADRRAFAWWILQRMTGRQVPLAQRKNPLVDLLPLKCPAASSGPVDCHPPAPDPSPAPPPRQTAGQQQTGHTETNSLEWWEDYFETKWENNSGREQTRHFMNRLVDSLPPFVLEALRQPGATILDWGCALGDGVDVLRQCFPAAVVHGYDFSPQAITTACKYYPDHTFFHPDLPGMLEHYDVVVCSNCLEHFADPLPVLADQLSLSRNLHLTLVPYAEENRAYCHEVTLTEASFPDTLANFRKRSTEIIEVDPQYWSGSQMMVVYQDGGHL
jgi:2-polyprenyl-3-methyl-5-hydroxy-6-metoxy-1,4-benzoquinol methylase